MIEHLWTSFVFAFTITFPGLALLFLGWFLKRQGQIQTDFVTQASKLVYNWALPALLFFSIYESETNFTSGGDLVMASIATMAMLMVIGGAYSMLRGFPREKSGFVVLSLYRGNVGVIGTALAATAYGLEGLGPAAFLAGVLSFVYNVATVLLLSWAQRSSNNSGGIVKNLLGIFTNPLILAVFLGYILREANVPMPEIASSVGHHLAKITLALSLIVVGASFNMKALFNPRDFAFKSAMARLIASPLVAIPVGLFFHLTPLEFGISLLMALTPVATVNYIMVKVMGGDAKATANVIAISNFFSMFVATLFITFCHMLGLMR